MVPIRGFEPRYPAPQAGVLPIERSRDALVPQRFRRHESVNADQRGFTLAKPEVTPLTHHTLCFLSWYTQMGMIHQPDGYMPTALPF